MIRAVVFDFDGLILDTEGPLFTAWQEAFAAHGCTLTVEDWSVEIGTIGGLDTVGLLRTRATKPVDEEAMHARRRARCGELMAREVPLPGVAAWIDEADALGLALAIASSSPPEWVHPQLERIGLHERFAHVACGSDGRAPKPAPDTYLLVALTRRSGTDRRPFGAVRRSCQFAAGPRPSAHGRERARPS